MWNALSNFITNVYFSTKKTRKYRKAISTQPICREVHDRLDQMRFYFLIFSFQKNILNVKIYLSIHLWANVRRFPWIKNTEFFLLIAKRCKNTKCCLNNWIMPHYYLCIANFPSRSQPFPTHSRSCSQWLWLICCRRTNKAHLWRVSDETPCTKSFWPWQWLPEFSRVDSICSENISFRQWWLKLSDGKIRYIFVWIACYKQKKMLLSSLTRPFELIFNVLT